MPSNFGIGHVFHVKNMTLEPVNDFVPSLFHIFTIAPIALQAINEISALTCAMPNSVVRLLLCNFVIVLDWDILSWYCKYEVYCSL